MNPITVSICGDWLRRGECGNQGCSLQHNFKKIVSPCWSKYTKKTALCSYFLQGKCNRLDCEFSHGLAQLNFPPRPLSKIRGLCTHWLLRNKCNQKNCVSHGVEKFCEKEKIAPVTTNFCPQWFLLGWCPAGRSCPHPHAVLGGLVENMSIDRYPAQIDFDVPGSLDYAKPEPAQGSTPPKELKSPAQSRVAAPTSTSAQIPSLQVSQTSPEMRYPHPLAFDDAEGLAAASSHLVRFAQGLGLRSFRLELSPLPRDPSRWSLRIKLTPDFWHDYLARNFGADLAAAAARDFLKETKRKVEDQDREASSSKSTSKSPKRPQSPKSSSVGRPNLPQLRPRRLLSPGA